MSTHVVGFRPPDDRWKQMKAIWDACEVAGVPQPDAVVEFFDYEPPDATGVEMRISTTPYQTESRQGVEVRIKDLPADVAVIRFFNSW